MCFAADDYVVGDALCVRAGEAPYSASRILGCARGDADTYAIRTSIAIVFCTFDNISR